MLGSKDQADERPDAELRDRLHAMEAKVRKLRDVRAVVFEKSNRVLQIRKVFACHDHIRQARHLPGSSCATEDRVKEGWVRHTVRRPDNDAFINTRHHDCLHTN